MLKSGGISKEELRRTAINNTWKEYPPEIKKMEDIISEIVLGQVTSEDDDEDRINFRRNQLW